MTLITTFYCVTGKTAPWSSEMEQTVGYYSNEQTAHKVAKFVREINMPELPGGIDVDVQKYQGEVIRCPAGLRLKDTSKGCIIMINEELNREEYQRLVNSKFQINVPEVVELKF